MMMLKAIARTVGLHRLILLNFYPYLQKYVQPHQRDVTNLLAAAIQACHDMVPPDAVEPLFKQIVNQFVHDRSRTEAITVGLNVVREICLRMPLLMTEDLLQDLVLYKKSHEKAVSSAARSLITLFREVCPSLLIKKDRGRPTDPKARPKAFGEVSVASNVPGVELLQDNDDDKDSSNDGTDMDEIGSASDDDHQNDDDFGVIDENSDRDDNDSDGDDASECGSGGSVDENYHTDEDSDGSHDEEYQTFSGDANIVHRNDTSVESESDDDVMQENGEASEGEDAINCGNNAANISEEEHGDEKEEHGESSCSQKTSVKNATGNENRIKESKAQKRKVSDFDGQLNAANESLRALKKLAGEKLGYASSGTTDGILSNEDFQRIKELKAKKEARVALTQHGMLRKGSDAKPTTFKNTSSDQLSSKRVDPAKLEVHLRKKLSKEERLALVRAGREERGKYQARTAVKQKKTGGLSNRQKEHKKAMPLAAKRSKVAKSRQDKRKKQQRSGKQFRGRKAWK